MQRTARREEEPVRKWQRTSLERRPLLARKGNWHRWGTCHLLDPMLLSSTLLPCCGAVVWRGSARRLAAVSRLSAVRG